MTSTLNKTDTPETPCEKPKLVHAWHSARQADCICAWIYRRADGEEVEVTQVADKEQKSLLWSDAAYLGLVIATDSGGFVRKVIRPLPESSYAS